MSAHWERGWLAYMPVWTRSARHSQCFQLSSKNKDWGESKQAGRQEGLHCSLFITCMSSVDWLRTAPPPKKTGKLLSRSQWDWLRNILTNTLLMMFGQCLGFHGPGKLPCKSNYQSIKIVQHLVSTTPECPNEVSVGTLMVKLNWVTDRNSPFLYLKTVALEWKTWMNWSTQSQPHKVHLMLDFEMPWHTAQVFTSYFTRAHFLSAYILYCQGNSP